MKVNPLIPSMFHRRLALLVLCVAGGMAVLVFRLGVLTVARGEDLRAEAEKALLSTRWMPTNRGRILDAKGRVLAQDRPAFDVAVDYDVISGAWASAQAARAARADAGAAWFEFSPLERESRLARRTPEFDAALRAHWAQFAAAAGLPEAEIERRKADILAEVQDIAAQVWERARQRRERELSEKAGKPVAVPLSRVARPVREQRQPHVILRGVDDATAFQFRRLAETMPGVRVTDTSLREYPFESGEVVIDRDSFPPALREDGSPARVRVEGVAAHLLGWMRGRVFAEDVERRPLRDPATGQIDPGHYQVGDAVGQAGAEAGFERALRGLRGSVTLHLDTGEREETPAVPGRDVRLTVDIALQARIQALLSPSLGLARKQEWHIGPNQLGPTLPIGTPFNGAAVVLDIASGNILAMVSTPTFTREQRERTPDAIFNDPVNSPWVNRALSVPYPPGSILKAPLLVAAITVGAHNPSRAVECTGHFFPNRPDMFRCWIYKQRHTTHSAVYGRGLSAPEALCVSCNIYFYTVGRELGPDRLVDWCKRFGVGSAWNLGIGAVEHPGVVTGSEGPSPSLGDGLHMAIGQGPVAWTPLHAADAFATIARGGLRLTPRMHADAPAHAADLRLSPDAVRLTMEGLRMAVNDRQGTGTAIPADAVNPRHVIFNAPGVDVWGKTGTAEAPDIVIDPDGKGPAPRQIAREGDHSWFVVLAGPKGGAPRYAISVIMEYAGSGGRVSGPICNQIIHALIAEGYLPDSAQPAPEETRG